MARRRQRAQSEGRSLDREVRGRRASGQVRASRATPPGGTEAWSALSWVLERLPDPVFHVDEEHRLDWANDVYLNLMGSDWPASIEAWADACLSAAGAGALRERLAEGLEGPPSELRAQLKTLEGELGCRLVLLSGGGVQGASGGFYALLYLAKRGRDLASRLDLVGGSAAPMAVLSPDGVFRLANKHSVQHFGADVAVGPMGLIGRRLHDIAPQAVADEYLAAIKRACTTRCSVFFENVRRRRASVHVYRVEAYPIEDAAGEVIGVKLLAQDVSAWRKAEAELALARQRFNRVARAAPVGIYRMALDGVRNYVNPRWKAITELAVDSGIGTDYRCGVLPADCAALEAAWLTLRKSGLGGRLEHRIVTPAGEVKWVLNQFEAERDEAGLTCGYIGTLVDTTDRKRAEQELHDTATRFRELAENIEDIFWTSSADQSEFYYVSPAAARISGWPLEKVIGPGSSWLDFVHPDDRAAMIAGGATSKVDQPLEFRLRIVRPDGQIRWMHTRVFPVFDAVGEHVRNVGVASDVTERLMAEREVVALNRELEERVAQRTAELEAANAELRAFSYSVSHDLRAPLRAIEGFSEAIGDDHGHELSRPARALFERVRGAALRMNSHIEGILRLSSASEEMLVWEIVDLAILARELIAEVCAGPLWSRVVFEAAETCPAKGDPRLLRALLQNLLDNACKFSQKSEAPHVELRLVVIGGQRCYRVSDNGIGFEPRHAETIFGAFQRLHPESRFGGSGLGLAIAQKIAERHGGRIWAESAPGEGARFYFTLGDEPTAA